MCKNKLEPLLKKVFERTEKDFIESDKFHNRIATNIEQMKKEIKERSDNRRFIQSKQRQD